MKLNKTSFSARFYQWFYETTLLPNNLCPYFWKLSLGYLLTVVFGLPGLLFILPVYLVYLIITKREHNEIKNKKIKSIVSNKFISIALGFVFYTVVVFVFCVIIFLLTAFNILPYVKLEPFQISGGTITIMSSILSVMFLLEYIFVKKKRVKKSPSVLIEFIKAKYKRYCPKIDWE